ncbi:MAG: hypothetical protein J2P56_06995 [Verrucomicrobia bacterium]|nr:hypothetical protein [Verrucomicrobiota bacterium]
MRKRKLKNPTASEMGKKGAPAANALRTPEQRKEMARKAAEARWKDHEYSTKQSAAWQRNFRLKRAREQNEQGEMTKHAQDENNNH